MLTRYFMTQPYVDSAIVADAQNVDYSPTLHFYGTLELPQEMLPEDAEAVGLVLADEVEEDFEADCSRLYRAEMGGRA